MAIVANKKNRFFDKLNKAEKGMRHIFVTGHKDGRVLLWRSDHYLDVLENYEEEISALTKCLEGIAIGTI